MNDITACGGSPPVFAAIEDCREWLVFCLWLGWSAAQVPSLEALWWNHHDSQGILVPDTGKSPL